MSLLPSQTNVNMDTYFFLRGNGQVLNVSTLNANTISTNSLTASALSTNTLDAEYINNSTINTLHVDLDGQILTANASELLLNGVPIATTSNISSIADWSYEPAVSTVQMAGYDINQAGTISTTNIRGGNAFFTNLIAFNAMFVSTYTSTISTQVNTAELGNYSSLYVSNVIQVANDPLLGPGTQVGPGGIAFGGVSSLGFLTVGNSSMNMYFETDHIQRGRITLDASNGILFTDPQTGNVDVQISNNILYN